ncbi:MAG: DNA repair protein RecO [Coriobacteriia bacterium]|nr:DNA repair protein RecO [Coriobacteriia bacterium]
MPSYSLCALVLRKTKLGETDSILTLLSSDGRQVRAVAKGLRRPGGRFGARLEPYAVVDLLVHSGKSLDIITEASTSSSHAGLREDLDRSSAAAVVADLIDKISVEGQSEQRLFGLAVATLDVLESAPLEALPSVIVAFLAKAMAMHGYRPELATCARCGADAAAGVRFSVVAGGALCPQCGEGDGGALPFGPEGRAWLERLLGAKMIEIPELGMPQAAVADCFDLLRAFAAFHVAARLRALDFYAGLLRS